MGSNIIPSKIIPSGTLKLDNVTKNFNGTIAVDSISLQVLPGERLALVGPSGCGKSTALRLIAGLETPDWGEIYQDEKCASRKVALLSEDLRLSRHMSVADHIGSALDKKRYQGEKRIARIKEIATLVNLDVQQSDKFPHQLSGVEQQRLAIGRALAQEPQFLLMDEPFSSLNNNLKNQLILEVDRLVAKLNLSLIYITNQWHEIVTLTDKVVFMQKGKIVSAMSLDEDYYSNQKNEPNTDDSRLVAQ